MAQGAVKKQVVIVGAGIAGLCAGLELAVRGFTVTLVDQNGAPGGKMREVSVAGQQLDAGPTVLTMRWVFEEIFADAGTKLDQYIALKPAKTLARHAWQGDEKHGQNGEPQRLDLFADMAQSVSAIAEFAGQAEAKRFREFSDRAKRIYQTLERPFIKSSRPGLHTLVQRVGLNRLGDLAQISPFNNLWRALGKHFHDPRLQQLFGRYATYCGSSPFMAPATLMLVAHVEREGVWLVEGGMHRLATALATLSLGHGAIFRYGETVNEVIIKNGKACGIKLASGEEIIADAVLMNTDIAAISNGLFGKAIKKSVPKVPPSARSLSAVTWNMVAKTSGFPLLRHNVFFSDDYAAEFNDIFRLGKLPHTPTVYVCAQDRQDEDCTLESERLLCLVNAPAIGDTHEFSAAEIARCETAMLRLLKNCGLRIENGSQQITTPNDFNRLFPATGGALYGAASHGWMASFRRPGSRSHICGVYLAGGSTHPGPGVPMAAISGRLAAAAIIEDM